MKQVKNKLIYLLPIALVMFSIFGVYTLSFSFYSSPDSPISDVSDDLNSNSKMVRIVCIGVQRGDGSIYGTGYFDNGCVENIVVNVGLNATRDLLALGTVFGPFDVISLSNGTAAVAGDTSAPDEWAANGLSRKVGDVVILKGSAGNWTVSTTFTSTTITGINVNKTCLFNQTTVAGSAMFSCVNFPEVTLDGTAGDTLFINGTYYVTSG